MRKLKLISEVCSLMLLIGNINPIFTSAYKKNDGNLNERESHTSISDPLVLTRFFRGFRDFEITVDTQISMIDYARNAENPREERLARTLCLIDYYGGIDGAVISERGREVLLAFVEVSDIEEAQLDVLRGIIRYYGGLEEAAKYEQGREALALFAQISGRERTDERLLAIAILVDSRNYDRHLNSIIHAIDDILQYNQILSDSNQDLIKVILDAMRYNLILRSQN